MCLPPYGPPYLNVKVDIYQGRKLSFPCILVSIGPGTGPTSLFLCTVFYIRQLLIFRLALTDAITSTTIRLLVR